MLETFLATAGWDTARRSPLAGDASARRYTRLKSPTRSAILMEDPEGDPARFAALARYLTQHGLSAPRILAEAPGLLLIEDLGDALFAGLADRDEATEIRLYETAIEALLALQRLSPPPGLARADADYFARQAEDALGWYLAGAGAETRLQDQTDLTAALSAAIDGHSPDCAVTILRDYHAENLIWLPEREGPARAGLLDFQDALVGHRAYDVVSLLEDARRDVSEPAREAAIRLYLGATGLSDEGFSAALAVQGAARNLRILGIFARLAAVRGKPHYVDMMPRVWAHLMRDLRHPALTDLAPRVTDLLPAPEPAVREHMKRHA